ncbi:MAG TPA: PEGA domain-containing protein [Vicinamibacterales bacterium]|nr:PEGA domain-containing protein [Vicinamibacterales bacterium]
MKLTFFGLTTAALLTTTLAVPAVAQERDARRREAARAEQNAQRQAQPPREAARSAEQPRRVEQARPAEQPRPAEQARPVDRARPRPDDARQVQRPIIPAPSVQAPVVAPRVETRSSAVVGRAVPRTSPAYNYDHDHHDSDHDRRYYDDHDRHYYGYAPHVYYAPRTYVVARPYVFRPHVSIGFGIFAGYPVPYAWHYTAPIYVYGYSAPRAPVYITPSMPLYGGIALEISPYDAYVYVDGNYAGRVQDFDGTVQPLTVVAGTHRIEVQAPGYAPLVFDVMVAGGQVIPYRGDLQPY